jgi:hypothetical protein
MTYTERLGESRAVIKQYMLSDNLSNATKSFCEDIKKVPNDQNAAGDIELAFRSLLWEYLASPFEKVGRWNDEIFTISNRGSV